MTFECLLSAIHSALRESLETSLYSHDAEHCFECNPAAREEQQKQDLSILSSASDSPAEKAHSTLVCVYGYLSNIHAWRVHEQSVNNVVYCLYVGKHISRSI